MPFSRSTHESMIRPDAVSRRMNMLAQTRAQSGMRPSKVIQPYRIPL
jgi:hypothetical protein